MLRVLILFLIALTAWGAAWASPQRVHEEPPRDAAQLLARYEPLVRHCARTMRTTTVVDADDLCQVGRLGLLRAAATWDAKRRVPFHSWAASLIRWAMREELRQTDLDLPPSVMDPALCAQEAPPPPAERNDLTDALRVVFRYLDPSQREIARWYYVDGLMVQDIGKRRARTASWASHKLRELRDGLARGAADLVRQGWA